MAVQENFAASQTGAERAKQEVMRMPPDIAVESEMSDVDFEQYVAGAETDMDQQATAVIPESEQRIAASAKSLNLSSETIETARQEQGLDGQLSGLQSEASQIADKAKLEIKAVTAETPVAAESPVVAKETVEATEEKQKLSEDEARKNWKTLSEGEKMAYCDPEVVSKEMSDDLQLKNSPESKPFLGELFSENNEVINDNIRNLVEAYIGEAKISPEYGEKIRKSTENYINLVSKAQQEGSVAENLKAEDIQKISEDIVNKMVYQNRESFKRGLGDHGVRHIIDGNITEAMKMVDEYDKANPEKPMTSLDRLKIMTVHFNHDMGYTVGVNRKGFESTGDHPKFSQKIFERQKDLYGKLFSNEDFEQMSKIIETHDGAEADFEKQPFESIVRLSDNLGLFHDSKLPEIFYSVPENMAVLQKIDLARKAGQSIDGLKVKLKENVMKQEWLSEDTRKALLNAAEEINKMAPDFNLGMLAGKLDGYEMRGSKMVVNIRESDMHKQIQELFELNQKQFVKALGSYGIKLDKMGTSFDQYVKVDADGTKYVELPMGEGKPVLRFNFLKEDVSKPDNRNAEVKKKFAETATEWAGINIRAEVKSAVKELKESKEARTSKKIDKISFELQAQLDDGKVSTEDREQMSSLVSNLKGSLDNEEEFVDKLNQLGKFLTKKEKDFLAVS